MTAAVAKRSRDDLDADQSVIRGSIEISGGLGHLEGVGSAPAVDLVGPDEPDDQVVAGSGIDDVGPCAARDRIGIPGAGDGEPVRLAAQIEDNPRSRAGERDRVHVDDLRVACSIDVGRRSRQAERIGAGRAIQRIPDGEAVEGVVAPAAGQGVGEGTARDREAFALVGEIDCNGSGRNGRRDRLNAYEPVIRGTIEVKGGLGHLERIGPAAAIDLIGANKADDEIVAGPRIDDVGTRTPRDGIGVSAAGDCEALRLTAEIEGDTGRRAGGCYGFDIDDLRVRRAIEIDG